MRRTGELMRSVVVLLVLLASVNLSHATCPSTPGTITYTPIKQNPQVGIGVADADYAQAFCLWAESDEAQRTESRTYALRPPATAALRSKLYAVSDCNTTSCTGPGGTTKCLTIVNDSNAWEVVGCFGASTADVSSPAGTYADNQIARFVGTTGDSIDNTPCTLSDTGVFGATCALPSNFVTPLNLASAGLVNGKCPAANGTSWTWNTCGGAAGGQGDITTDFGLTCDGTSTTGEHAALQTVINNGTAAGLTIRIPPGKVCTIGATVVPKSNVNIHCEGNSGFKAVGASITGSMFASGATDVNNWTIDGCTFDLNGKSGVGAFQMTNGGSGTGGTPWHFWRNTVKNVGAGAASAYPLVRLDCTGGTGTCDIVGNSIIGSNTTTTTNDTCLAVYASGAGFFAPTGTIITANHLENCGANGLELLGAGGGVVANEIINAHNVGITTTVTGGNPGQNVNIVSNAISATNGCMKFLDAHNMNIEANQCGSGGAHGIWMVATGGGPGNLRNRIIGNYVVANIYLQVLGTCGGACTNPGASCSRDGGAAGTGCLGGSCGAANDGCTGYPNNDGNIITGNLLQAEAAGPSHRDPGVWIENPTNTVIANNQENTLATTTDHDFIRLTQLTGGIIGSVLVNANSATGGSGTGLHRCIVVEAPETTGDAGPFNNLTFTGNSCGVGDVGIDLGTGTTAPGASSNLIIRSNSLTQEVTTLVGYPGNFDTGFPPEDIIGQRGNLRSVGWQRDTGTGYTTNGAGFKASGTSVDPIGITSSGSSVVLWQADFADTQQAFYTVFTNTGATDVGGWVWPLVGTMASGGIERQWKPLINMVVKTPNVDANQRYWCGLFSKTDSASVPGSANPSGVAGAGFRFDGGSDTSPCQTGTMCWRAWSNDGTGTGGSTTPTVGGIIDGATRYMLSMDMSSGTDIKYYVNGTLIATRTSSDDIPAGNASLGWLCSVTNRTTVSHTISVASTFVEYPF